MTKDDKAKPIHVILRSQIKEFLDDGGLQITNGNVFCNVCGEKINLDKVGFIFSRDHKLQIACKRLQCTKELLHTEEHSK